MKKLIRLTGLLTIVAVIFLLACSKDEDVQPSPASPVAGKTLLFEASSVEAGADVKVYADKALYTGYNRIYVLIYEAGTGSLIKDAHVSLVPEMTMTGGMSHAAPVEDPLTATPANGLFEGSVVFVMPSEGNGQWSLEVHIHNHNANKEGHVKGNLSVVDPEGILLYSFLSIVDSTQYFVSLVEPANAKSGLNDFEVVVHEMQSADIWAPLTGLHIEVEPYMPSMGHGSSGNINPEETSNGHYAGGVVNLSMSGLWQLRMTIRDGADKVIDDGHHFEITL